jgi:hypothetical protein
MLTIREEQMRALSAVALKDFEIRMVRRLKAEFPSRCAAYGDDGTKVLVQQGIQQASKYGIVAQPQVCAFIELMFKLSPTFDSEARFAWATQILNDDTLLDPGEKVERLRSEAGKRRSASEPP